MLYVDQLKKDQETGRYQELKSRGSVLEKKKKKLHHNFFFSILETGLKQVKQRLN